MGKDLKMSDVMTPCPYHVSSASSLEDVLRVMGLRSVRHLPVVEDGNLIGVLTERDVELSQFVCDTISHCPTAGDIGMRNPYVVPADAEVGDVAQNMAENKLDFALVSDEGGSFVGIFTTTDACRLIHLLLGNED
ncbi:CBS domain-containing protein [Oligoflexia bacterium]|nr:CBS domain-containing protein [Oligoflexia bacterium]